MAQEIMQQCFKCSKTSTYIKPSGKALWLHDNVGNTICKKCYDTKYRRVNKVIDLSKLKKKRGNELTFIEPHAEKEVTTTSTSSSSNNDNKKLTKMQKDVLKERLSIPMIGKVSESDSNKICNMCGNSYQCLYDSTHQYTLLSFEVLVRGPKRLAITCHLCNDCLGNMNSIMSAIKKRNLVTNKMDMATMGRDQRESHWLWQNRIGWKRKDDGSGYSYYKLPQTSLMQADLD